MWLLRIILVLWLGEQVAVATGLPSGFVPVHQSETYLQNAQIDPASLRKLLIWDGKQQEWRIMQPGEAPGERTPVLILHLWADYCEPCREEFPIVRELAEQIATGYADRVKVLYLSETDSSDAMETFMQKYQARLPKGPHYLDTAEAIAATLRQRLPGSLSLPVTLVLDEQRVVRYAIVGSLARRRNELAIAIESLVSALKRPLSPR